VTIELRWGSATDVGRVRPANEDAALAETDLFVVADGVGGNVAGEIASNLAVEAIREHIEDGLEEAIRAANRAVWERSDTDASLRGMGTTVTAVALVRADGSVGDDQLEVANVGDSRAYLFRDGHLEQVTDDHSLVGDLEREGRISKEEARVHPRRNIVTRVLGNDPDVDVDIFPLDPFRGDRLVLCSDGLSDELDDTSIAEVLARHSDPQAAADALVRSAFDVGGRDNITVVIVDVVDDGGKARAASASLAGTQIASQATRVVPAEPDTAAVGGAATPSAPRTRRRLVTWRSAGFVVLLLLVVGAAVWATWLFGRSTYFVGLEGDEIIIFRGRPGGVLFLDPTVEERTGLTIADVPTASLPDLDDGKQEASLADARRYVARLEQRLADEREAAGLTTTTTVPTTTTTTVPPVNIFAAPAASP
jgi:PPM family protein phosphatase